MAFDEALTLERVTDDESFEVITTSRGITHLDESSR